MTLITDKIQKADHNLQRCGQRDRQPHPEQGRIRLPAHKVGHRDADAEGSDNPLEHDKGSMAAPVKVPDKTEEEGQAKEIAKNQVDKLNKKKVVLKVENEKLYIEKVYPL